MPVVNKVKKSVTKSKSGSVMDRIQPIGFDADEGISINLYGRSGTGKTTLWGSFPKPILAIIASGGKNPGELRSLDTPENRKSIFQVVLKNSREIIEITEALAEGSKYKTIVIDHVSGLQDRVLAEILDLDEIPAQKSWGLASQQQYGQCTLQCKELLRKILDLKMHRVLVAQERDFNTEGDSDLLLPYVASALSPSLVGWLNPACDYICNTFIRPKMVEVEAKIGGKTKKIQKQTDQVEYCLRTGADSVYTTKFRQPKGKQLPKVIVDPTFDKLFKLINGGQ